MSNLVLDISAKDFKKEVLEANVPVLVDFWAPWCEPCKMMIPALNQLAEKMGEKAKVIKVNVENPENRELAFAYEIRSIPNMKIFKQGQVVEEFIGLRDVKTLREALEKFA